MNEIVNKCLLAGVNFMPQMHLKQSGFTWSACEPLAKINEKYKNSNKPEIHDMFIKTN